MSKTYKTAMGKSIDMGAMVLANEKVRAVGNQKVNAKGDIIDSNNNVVKTRQQQLAEQYGTQAKKKYPKLFFYHNAAPCKGSSQTCCI